jgi:hypothetical protein
MAGLADAQMALAAQQAGCDSILESGYFAHHNFLSAQRLKKEMRRVSVRQQLLPAAIS